MPNTRPFPKFGADFWGPNDMYVPAGWCWIGGDPLAADSLPQKRIWVDGFVMGKFALTVGEYLDFLNELVLTGRADEAWRVCPRVPTGDAFAFPQNDRKSIGCVRGT